MTSVAMANEPQSIEPSECEACRDLRAALRLCLGALAKYYGEELDRNDWRELSVSELVQGGVVLRAERALRAPCRCGGGCG